MLHWLIDGNNVFGSRPDGWWNDRSGAAARLADRVAIWCRDHHDEVVLVFDRPVAAGTLALSGGNLRIEEAPRRGRDAADDHLVDLADRLLRHRRAEGDGDEDGDDGVAADDSRSDRDAPGDVAPTRVVVVSSDRGLIRRLPPGAERWGVGRFRDLIGY